MSWNLPSENSENNVENEKPSVIKKLSLGLPVGKLVNSPDHQEIPYMNRIPQMQSILTIRPDQFRQTPTPQNSEITRNSVIMTHQNEDPVKANSIESPPEKSDEELIEPGSPDKPFVSVIQPNETGKNELQMDVDSCDPQGGCCGPQGCGDHKVQ